MNPETPDSYLRKIISEVFCDDAMNELLPTMDFGFYAEGGCRKFEQVLEHTKIQFECYQDDYPENCQILEITCGCGDVTYTTLPPYGWEIVKSVSEILWRDIQDLWEEAEQSVKDADEIADTEVWIDRNLAKEQNHARRGYA
tara:strand:- start:7143 stop:7568 length:426 start_codon:yes stop_codon:yes gene_type:complete